MIPAVAQGLVEPNSPALIAQACDGPPATWPSGRGTGAAYDSRGVGEGRAQVQDPGPDGRLLFQCVCS